MKLLPAITILALSTTLVHADDAAWLTFEGKEGPGKGKHIVLLAGDEEYRSEEALPMLGKILAERHGFKCTVLFSINPAGWTPRDIAEYKKANNGAEPDTTKPDPKDGTIDPNEPANIPGMEKLEQADLVIMSWRFRKPAGMQHFVDYYMAGKPFIALRTSTHAFSGLGGEYAKFNKFGENVLGEEWVTHWGRHKAEATRGVIEPGAENHPILRGVENIFGDTDVYEAYPPADAKILVRGLVLKGMKPEDAPADYTKKRVTDKAEQPVNDPAMPVAWTREHTNEAGKVNRIFTTTMGSATDLANEGMRRLVVNGAFALTGLEVPAKADVTPLEPFTPTMYGFNTFIPGKRPADYGLKR